MWFTGGACFPGLHTADPTMQALPCLSFPLFLIIELNGIKSFFIGIFFYRSRPFEQPEGDFNTLLPFDTVPVLEVGEL